MSKLKIKLYYRNSNGQILRLDKKSPELYMFVMTYLIDGGYERFNEKNKEQKYKHRCVPIELIINQTEQKIQDEFKKLKLNKMIIYYNSMSLKLISFV